MVLLGGEILNDLGASTNDTLTTLLVASITFGFWLLRTVVTEYFTRKRGREEKKRDKELSKLLEKDIHLHEHRKSEDVGKSD